MPSLPRLPSLGSLLLLAILIAVLVSGDEETSPGGGGGRHHAPHEPAQSGGAAGGRGHGSAGTPSGENAGGGGDAGGAGVVAPVVDVVDGDTIEVSLGGEAEDVRYIGVDTPETVKPGAPVECYGPEASAANHGLVEGARVRLVFDAERRDVYGRLLAYVYLERSGEFVNAELLRRGFATTLTIAPNDRFAARFDRIEQRAANAGRGLWEEC